MNTSSSSSRAFFYVDGNPTKGLWIDLDECTTDVVIRAALVAGGYMEEDYGGDILAADAEGLAREFLSSSDCFALDAFIVWADFLADHGHIEEDAVIAYLDWLGTGQEPSDFEDAYRGQYDSEEAFAEDLMADSGELSEMPEHLRSYFDFAAYGRDLCISDFHMTEDGYTFWNN